MQDLWPLPCIHLFKVRVDPHEAMYICIVCAPSYALRGSSHHDRFSLEFGHEGDQPVRSLSTPRFTCLRWKAWQGHLPQKLQNRQLIGDLRVYPRRVLLNSREILIIPSWTKRKCQQVVERFAEHERCELRSLTVPCTSRSDSRQHATLFAAARVSRVSA